MDWCFQGDTNWERKMQWFETFRISSLALIGILGSIGPVIKLQCR